eukprot:UN24271
MGFCHAKVTPNATKLKRKRRGPFYEVHNADSFSSQSLVYPVLFVLLQVSFPLKTRLLPFGNCANQMSLKKSNSKILAENENRKKSGEFLLQHCG